MSLSYIFFLHSAPKENDEFEIRIYIDVLGYSNMGKTY